ncbi:MAG: hypothetical protein FRX48_04792 [Lasallia pustulata]|uniref:Uncharacterized protein n=1 Tax=Lasallia pustulata TaxID=136370 RepID=A0A5M8PR44_9LECA|nr:MAG: hypothetical protein FRX48_04792 [Lasallia pustulata]
MSRFTIALSKFVGCISLGLLTGTSYTLTTITLPPLLALPSAPQAHSSFRTLLASTRTHQRALSLLSVLSLSLAYALSPRRGRHPYLLWTAAVVGTGWGFEEWVGDGGKGKGKAKEEGVDVNGEVVREGLERWRWGQVGRGRWRGGVGDVCGGDLGDGF